MICNGNVEQCNYTCNEDCKAGCFLCSKPFRFSIFTKILKLQDEERVCWMGSNGRIVFHKECAKEFAEKLTVELAVDSIERKGW